MAGRRPRVQRKHAGEGGETGEDQGHDANLRDEAEASGRDDELGQAETIGPSGRIGPEHAGEHQRAAREGVEHELHRAVFAVGGAPFCDEEIFRDDGDLVEDEEHEGIHAEEDAVNAADEREVEGEELAGALLDVPREQHTHGRRKAGEHEESQADAVGREVVADAKFGNPRHVDQALQPRGRREARGRHEDDAPGGEGRDERHDARRRGRTRPGDQREQRTGKGDVDGAGQGVHGRTNQGSSTQRTQRAQRFGDREVSFCLCELRVLCVENCIPAFMAGWPPRR